MTATISEQVGLLTKVGQIEKLVIASCMCGFPSVLIPEEMWQRGEVVGCQKCHVAYADKQRREAVRAAKDREYQEEQKALQIQQRDWNLLPHFEELSPQLKTLFRRLCQYRTFDTESIARMTGQSRDNAWTDILLPLLEANLLLELVGLSLGVRPYSPSQMYAAGANPASRFRVRPVAKKQMEDLESAPIMDDDSEDAPATLPISSQTDSLIAKFINSRCTAGAGESESLIVLRARFMDFIMEQQDLKESAPSPEDFTAGLERVGLTLTGGKVRGLRLRKLKELAQGATN